MLHSMYAQNTLNAVEIQHQQQTIPDEYKVKDGKYSAHLTFSTRIANAVNTDWPIFHGSFHINTLIWIKLNRISIKLGCVQTPRRTENTQRICKYRKYSVNADRFYAPQNVYEIQFCWIPQNERSNAPGENGLNKFRTEFPENRLKNTRKLVFKTNILIDW